MRKRTKKKIAQRQEEWLEKRMCMWCGMTRTYTAKGIDLIERHKVGCQFNPVEVEKRVSEEKRGKREVEEATGEETDETRRQRGGGAGKRVRGEEASSSTDWICTCCNEASPDSESRRKHAQRKRGGEGRSDPAASKSKTPEQERTCSCCNTVYKTVAIMRVHVQRKEGKWNRVEPIEERTCKICGFVSTTKANRKQHEEVCRKKRERAGK